MLLTQQQKQATPLQEQEADGQFGDAFIPAGEYVTSALPPNLIELVNRLDIASLPMGADAKYVLEQIQRETIAHVQSRAVDVRNVPVQKITDLSQLTAEQRSLLSGLISGEKHKHRAPTASQVDGVQKFSSPEELFAHVNSRIAQASAVEADNVEVAAQPAAAGGGKGKTPLFTQQAADDDSDDEEADEPAVAEPVKRKKKEKPKRPYEGLEKCPHCDLLLADDPVEITDEQIQEFLYSVLHHTSYFEVLELFGGNMKIKMVALTNLQQDYLSSLTETIGAREDLSQRDKYDFYLRSSMVMGVTEVHIADKKWVYRPFDVDGDVQRGIDRVLNRYAEISKQIPAADILNMLCAEVIRFNFRCRTMIAKGLNADFWKPIQ